jgi:hypothetical protein
MSGPDKSAGRFSIIQIASDNNEGNKTGGDKGTKVTDSLYEFAKVDGSRWNQLYPYQLLVVQRTASGWEQAGAGSEGWFFTLPISPQSIDIDMPFAITTSATLGGVIEEHNGAPFRMINFAGTTGVLPLKGALDVVQSFNVAQGIFAGTINAVGTTGADISRSLNISSPNVVPDTEFTTNASTSSINLTSGYFQWHQLRQFFEVYAQKKKTSKGKEYRLAFAMWKDESVYLVTPMLFKTQRDAGSPYEYRYNLSLKAWARVKLQATDPVPDNSAPIGRDPNLYAKLVTALEGARTAIDDARKIIQSVRGDVESALLTPMREVMLAAKGVAGVALTLADLPGNIITDSKEAILQVKKELDDLQDVPAEVLAKIQELGSISNKSGTGDSRLQKTEHALRGPHPVNKIFAKPSDNYDVFSRIDPAKIKLPLNVQRQIADEKSRVGAFTRNDYEIRRDSVVSVLVDFAEAVGLGSDTFNHVYNIQPSTTSSRTATDDDYDVIFNLNNVVTEFNRLCVSNTVDSDDTDAIQYIAGLARKSGIAFTEPRSKFLVPFLSNHTLEELALMYLGDANRWQEIATLNGLREPYVDEVGFDIFLSTNGDGNIIQLADTTNLYNGQFIYISSSTQNPQKRRILGIQRVTNGINYITLDGDNDLDTFTTSNQAKIHAYLPDTVNSQMSIYIPSQDDPEQQDFQTKPIPGVDYFDNLVRVGGISLLLSNNNDIIFTSAGATKLAAGLTNIVQKVRIALATPQGALLQHPSYGLPVKVGDSTADVSASNVLKSIQEMFSKDPSFSGVTSAFVSKNTGTTQITVSVGIAGTSQVIPITADIRR